MQWLHNKFNPSIKLRLLELNDNPSKPLFGVVIIHYVFFVYGLPLPLFLIFVKFFIDRGLHLGNLTWTHDISWCVAISYGKSVWMWLLRHEYLHLYRFKKSSYKRSLTIIWYYTFAKGSSTIHVSVEQVSPCVILERSSVLTLSFRTRSLKSGNIVSQASQKNLKRKAKEKAKKKCVIESLVELLNKKSNNKAEEAFSS